MHTAMRNVLLGSIAATIITAQSAMAATAYDAMHVVGKSKGAAVLETITEVRGTHGSPQPRSWRISTRATSYDVRGGGIAGTSAGRSLTPLNLSELKLDSDGAHTVAEREAKKAAFSYDYADYTLRTGSKSTPVWEVRLVDEKSDATAVLNIGADSGKVVSSTGLKKSATKPQVAITNPPPAPPVEKIKPTPPAPTERIAERPSDAPPKPPRRQEPQYVQDDPANYDPADEPAPPPRRRAEPQEREERADRGDRDYDEDGDDSQYEQGYQKVFDRVGKHLTLRGGQVRSWFDRTILSRGRSAFSRDDRNEREYEEPRRTAPRTDPNATRYYRPDPGSRVRD